MRSLARHLLPAVRLLLLTTSYHVALALETPPLFTLNLDLPPRQRWRGALGLVLAAHDFESGFLPTFSQHNSSLFNHLPASAWPVLTTALSTYWPEQAEELKGIADDFAAAGHPEITYDYLVGWAYFHELAHSDALKDSAFYSKECTALLARVPGGADGDQASTLFVGNMDQSPPSVRNVTLRVRFTKGNTTVFDGVDWYWFTTGVSRAVRKGVASLQENWRSLKTLVPLDEMLKRIKAGPSVATPQMYVFREVLLKDPPLPSFEGLVDHLASVPLAAPFYIIAGGPSGEGAVLARNQTASVGTARLGGGGANGFLVQTNYDHWLPDPKTDPRRSSAEAMLSQISKEAEDGAAALTTLDLFAVASAYPVHNPHTAFTAVLDPQSGKLHAYVRDGMCPVKGVRSADPRYCAA